MTQIANVSVATELPLGPVMLDVAGLILDADDRRRLRQPAVGGVILFARNFRDCVQLAALTAEIHSLRTPALPIAVDHEGGRVQRFRHGFTRVPPMAVLGQLWDTDPEAAGRLALQAGLVLAAELRRCGVDFTFAPVLDLDHARSAVIGDRAFHSRADAVSELATALVRGLALGGMGAVGKHFPGHGFAAADSHVDMPVDPRNLAQLREADLVPFARLVAAGLEGIMPAHVVYPAVTPDPAGYSRFWLQQVLRTEMGFEGVIFSDDLTMVGAHGAGDIVNRANVALDAGCDVVLVCNDPVAADRLLDGLDRPATPAARAAIGRLAGRSSTGHGPPFWETAVYHEAVDSLRAVMAV